MPTYASIQVGHVKLEAKASATVPAGSIFLDSGTNEPTIKPVSGSPISFQSPVSYFIKTMISSAAFAKDVPVSKLANGKAVASDADTNASDHVGFSMQAATGPDQSVSVFLAGPNLAGILSGLGFNPGDQIFLDKNIGQLVRNITSFGPNDGIVLVGIADCADGIASGSATDLIVARNGLSLP